MKIKNSKLRFLFYGVLGLIGVVIVSTFLISDDHTPELPVSPEDAQRIEKRLIEERNRLQPAIDERNYEEVMNFYRAAFTTLDSLPKIHGGRWLVYHSYGIWLGQLGDHQNAIRYFRKAQAICEHPELPPSPQRMAPSLSRIGMQFLSAGNQDSAVWYFSTPLRSGSNVQNFEAPTLNNMGVHYSYLEDHEQALKYFRLALAGLKPAHLAKVFGLKVQINITESYLANGMLDSAILMRNQVIANEVLPQRDLTQYLFYQMQGKFAIAMQQYESGEVWIDSAIYHLKQVGMSQFHEARRMEKLFDLQLELFKDAGWFEKGVRVFEQKTAFLEKRQREDEMWLHRTLQSIQEAEDARREQLAELKILQASNDRYVLVGWLVAIGGLLIALTFFAFRRISKYREALAFQALSRRLVELEAEESRTEAKEMERKMKLNQQDVDKMSEYVSLTVSWLDEFKSLLSESRKISDTERKAKFLDDLINQFRSRLSQREISGVLLDNINNVNAAFEQELSNLYPTLTPGERELCGLIRLKLTNKEIAEVKKVAPSSVKTLKFRLKKKLQLSADQNLTDHLLSLGSSNS